MLLRLIFFAADYFITLLMLFHDFLLRFVDATLSSLPAVYPIFRHCC